MIRQQLIIIRSESLNQIFKLESLELITFEQLLVEQYSTKSTMVQAVAKRAQWLKCIHFSFSTEQSNIAQILVT